MYIPEKTSSCLNFYNFKNKIIVVTHNSKHKSFFIQPILICDFAFGDSQFPFSFIFSEMDDLINHVTNELSMEMVIHDDLIKIDGVEINLNKKSGVLTIK